MYKETDGHTDSTIIETELQQVDIVLWDGGELRQSSLAVARPHRGTVLSG